MGGDEGTEGLQYLPVRCIICHRIKQPVSEPASADLQGMRCDLGCPGYTLDPPAPSATVQFVRHVGPPPMPAGDRMLDVIGRALCEVHFGR
jgi:hypothetical protein